SGDHRHLPPFPTRRSSDLTAARSAASLEEDIRAARASGASSNTRPRFVLDGTQRAVASTAARIVAPSGCSPAAASAGPIATALRSEEHTSELQSRGHLVCR